MAKAIIARIRETEAALVAAGSADLAAIQRHLAAGSAAMEEAVSFVVANVGTDIRGVYAGSVPYLKLVGVVTGGWQMARAALAAQRLLKAGNSDVPFLEAKIATARFYADQILSQALGYRAAVIAGSAGVMALSEDQF